MSFALKYLLEKNVLQLTETMRKNWGFRSRFSLLHVLIDQPSRWERQGQTQSLLLHDSRFWVVSYAKDLFSGGARVSVTRGGKLLTVSPLFFPSKNCHRYKVMTFFSCRLLTTPQLPSSDIVLPSVLCKFSHNFFHSGVTPLDGVTRSGPPPP